jgi:quercetin dioxygenase-like cupin family protein
MKEIKPVLIHQSESPVGGLAVCDIEPRQFSDREGHWAGWAARICNEPGDVSTWHHHPASDTYVYVIRGSITIDFGLDGAECFSASAGDFFFIPAQLIHRESTSPDSELEAFVIRIGELPEKVVVEGPLARSK